MGTIKIGYNNRIDEATLTGGSWSATLPLANLKTRPLSKLARTSDAAIASATINIDFGAATYYVSMVGLVAHNIAAGGKVKVRGSTVSDFTTNVYDSGWVDVWPSGVIPISLLEWEDDNF